MAAQSDTQPIKSALLSFFLPSLICGTCCVVFIPTHSSPPQAGGMPITSRQVEPVEICRARLPQGCPNDLEAVSVNALAGIIAQLGVQCIHRLVPLF